MEGTPALATQLDIIEWIRTEPGLSWADWFADSVTGIKKVNGVDALIGEVEKLGYAETVFVSRQMCDVIEKAAHELPDVPLQPDSLFWNHAFVYFERPIRGGPLLAADIEQGAKADGPLFTRAVSWSLTDVVSVERLPHFENSQERWDWFMNQDEETKARLVNSGVTHMTWIDTDYLSKIWDIDESQTFETVRSRIVPYDLSGWGFGTRWETVDNEAVEGSGKVGEALAVQRKIFLATNLIAAQYIAVVSGRKGARSQRRRALRMAVAPNFGDIRYVTLRRADQSRFEDVEGYENDPDFEYSHRFVVRGHWRHQYYPSKGRHELIWIDPFVKGPEHKPLIIKDDVFKLVR